MDMAYGAPEEAILYNIIRQNYDCSYPIIERDNVVIGSYYGPFDAQKIFDELILSYLHIQPLKLSPTFGVSNVTQWLLIKACPHAYENRLLISGRKLREMITRGERLPKQFSRGEAIDFLVKYY